MNFAESRKRGRAFYESDMQKREIQEERLGHRARMLAKIDADDVRLKKQFRVWSVISKISVEAFDHETELLLGEKQGNKFTSATLVPEADQDDVQAQLAKMGLQAKFGDRVVEVEELPQ